MIRDMVSAVVIIAGVLGVLGVVVVVVVIVIVIITCSKSIFSYQLKINSCGNDWTWSLIYIHSAPRAATTTTTIIIIITVISGYVAGRVLVDVGIGIGMTGIDIRTTTTTPATHK